MSANRGDRHHLGRITAFLPARSGFQGAATAMHSPVVLSDLAYMVVFNTMYAFWGQSTMQAFLSSTEAGVVFSLEPVTAGMFGIYLVGETLCGLQLVGTALIIVATISDEALPRVLRNGIGVDHPQIGTCTD